MSMKVTEEMIRVKAYELWEAGGKLTGSAEQNWFEAQALLLGTGKAKSSKRNQMPPIGLRQLTPP